MYLSHYLATGGQQSSLIAFQYPFLPLALHLTPPSVSFPSSPSPLSSPSYPSPLPPTPLPSLLPLSPPSYPPCVRSNPSVINLVFVCSLYQFDFSFFFPISFFSFRSSYSFFIPSLFPKLFLVFFPNSFFFSLSHLSSSLPH